MAVPVQQTVPAAASRASGWNAPASYQAPLDSSRAGSASYDPRSNYRTAARETLADAYRANTYPAGTSTNGTTQTLPSRTGAYPNPSSPTGYPSATPAANYSSGYQSATPAANYSSGYQNATPAANYSSGYQNATPVNNYSSGYPSKSSQGNYSTWGSTGTYSTAGSSSGNGVGTYSTSPAGGTSTQTTESGAAQFQGGIDKTTVGATYDSTGSSIR